MKNRGKFVFATRFGFKIEVEITDESVRVLQKNEQGPAIVRMASLDEFGQTKLLGSNIKVAHEPPQEGEQSGAVWIVVSGKDLDEAVSMTNDYEEGEPNSHEDWFFLQDLHTEISNHFLELPSEERDEEPFNPIEEFDVGFVRLSEKDIWFKRMEFNPKDPDEPVVVEARQYKR